MRRSVITIVVGLGIASAIGCAFVDSSESISKSVSSPFESSSASSGGGDQASNDAPEQPVARQAYADELRRLGATYAHRPGEIGALRIQVSKLATARGITNWEADALTCTSLVEGARAGHMSPAQEIAFSHEICPPQ